MMRVAILVILLAGASGLTACGVDGEPLTPEAKTVKG